MSLDGLKFKKDEFAGKDIASLPDQPKIPAQELKERFDNIGKMMIALGNFNELINVLSSTEGANEIGINSIEGLTADTVEKAINELNTFKASLNSPEFTGKPTAPTIRYPRCSDELATVGHVYDNYIRMEVMNDHMNNVFYPKHVTQSDLDFLRTHKADRSNPHSVTKVQVGLGNVDNTCDADKPVSNAARNVLNTKLDRNDVTSVLGCASDKVPSERAVVNAVYTKQASDERFANLSDLKNIVPLMTAVDDIDGGDAFNFGTTIINGGNADCLL